MVSQTMDGVGGAGRGARRRRRALVKKRKAACSSALGEDIRWSQILQMASFTLVGNIIEKTCLLTVIENWIKDASAGS